MGRVPQDLTGKQFGRWTVLGPGAKRGKHKYYACRCECGAEKQVSGDNLKYGQSLSCGCLKSEKASERRVARVERPEDKRPDRLVSHASETLPLTEWAKRIGVTLSTIYGRLDRGWNLERAATEPPKPGTGRSSRRYLTYNGQTLLLTEWAEQLGISRQRLADRIRRGWSVAEALGDPGSVGEAEPKKAATCTQLSPVRFKVCPSCGCTKPLTADFFHVSRASKTGHTPSCSVCLRSKRKAYYYANPEAEKARHGEWVRNNRVRANEQAAASKAKYPERYKETQRRWRQQNKARILAKNRARKAMIRAAERDHYDDAELHAMWVEQDGLCFYCDTPLFAVYHVEHKTPLSRGGTDRLTNICLSCPACNLRKGVRTTEEYKSLLGRS